MIPSWCADWSADGLTKIRALAVISAHRNGKLAVDDIERSNPDVVILDIEMPELDGLAALPLMLKKKSDLVVIMASTLTRRNGEASLKALSLGAKDYVPKPESNSGVTTSVDFRRDLIEKVKNLGMRAKSRAARPARPAQNSPATAHPERARAQFAAPARPAFVTKPYSRVAPGVLIIGSSTGGPPGFGRSVPAYRAGHEPRTGSGNPTYATDLYRHFGRTYRKDVRTALCRRAGRRTDHGRQNLHCPRWQAHVD